MPPFPDWLSLPRAWGPPVASGRIRVEPEDFVVSEWLGFEADGQGDHLLLKVVKRGANTRWVAKQLARQAGVHPREVGYAGLKDRQAVTEQSFSVPAAGRRPADWSGFEGEGFRVTAAACHRRKLRRGALKGNDFRIVVRDVATDPVTLGERLEYIARHGVPGFFGPQRFGRDGRNLAVAARWFESGRAPADRLVRGFALSAARAALFNEVLRTRIERGTWNRLLAGDVANLQGSGSVFAVETVDEVLLRRTEQLDIHPTGPLWGSGSLLSAGAVAALEQGCMAPWNRWAEGLADSGLRQERRALRLVVHDPRWRLEGDRLELCFRLGRGAFATAVLAEILAPAAVAALPEPEGD